MTNIIDGKTISEEIILDIKRKVEKLEIKPGLAIILVGNNPASVIYVNLKEKRCKEIGFYSIVKRFDENMEENKLIEEIETLNLDEKIHGIIVQLPLPNHLNTKKVINKILPSKDVDGLTSNTPFIPATPRAIMKLIETTEINLKGKHVVLVGYSQIVGKPLSHLLQEKHATITICDKYTVNLKNYTKQADVLIAAVGKPNLITKDMVKQGAMVIDVGINKIDGKVAGDVEDSVKEVADYISPVPGGVGPMTVAMLLKNTLETIK